MKILLATLCLNEMEWLEKLYLQHATWPGIVSWVFVEAADRVFAETNPALVSPSGLSVDGTSAFLEDLADRDERVTYIPYGFSAHPKHPDQGKCAARSKYLEVADELKPDFVMVLDADEFYPLSAQSRVNETFARTNSHDSAFIFRQRHVWRPPSVQPWPEAEGAGEAMEIIQSCESQYLFSQEVTGGYWDVPHTRGWRWEKGMRYLSNHNWPEDSYGRLLNRKNRSYRGDRDASPRAAQCIHLGYASSGVSRKAKHAYYEARGEGKEGGRIGAARSMYVECRRAYESWSPGDPLPHGARVVPYTGEIPEVFRPTPRATGMSV